ncbi:MAG TPA: hypothetical protein VKU41_04390 [Polyangiaceae bacterium]|nr:hypothetical protein [Polyangiaceae bacterium]
MPGTCGAYPPMPRFGQPFLLVATSLVASCADSASGPGSFDAQEGGEAAGHGSGAGTPSGSGAGSGGATASGATTSSGGSATGGDDAGADGSGVSPGSGSGSAGATSTPSGDAGGLGDDATGGGTGDASDGSAPSATACTAAKATCTGSNSGCNVGKYYLYDNQWNCGPSSGNHCGAESAFGCANADGTVSWVVTSNQPAGNTAVLTYPSMQDNFNSKPLLGSFSAITATFTETSPHVGDYEVAWDCWFNDNANELMIWVDNYNQTPGGNKVGSKVSLGGRSYDVWWSPSSGTGGYLAFVANQNFTSGTVDLLEIFKYGAAHGWLPTGSAVDQLSFGVEVCSTDGKDARWTVSDYSLTAN